MRNTTNTNIVFIFRSL